VDVAAGQGVGVNGLDLTACAVEDGQVRLKLASPFAWNRKPVIVFHRTEPARRYRVLLDGIEAGSWSGAELEKGIPLGLSKRVQ
jgi:hypothetical protein